MLTICLLWFSRQDHSGTIEEDELVHCMQTNKVARGLAKQFPALQALIGMSREERRQRARARRRSTKMKGKSRRRRSKKKQPAARPSLTRKRSGTIKLDELDDLARASAAHDAQEHTPAHKGMGKRRGTMQRGTVHEEASEADLTARLESFYRANNDEAHAAQSRIIVSKFQDKFGTTAEDELNKALERQFAGKHLGNINQ